jgi:hypothetical protein
LVAEPVEHYGINTHPKTAQKGTRKPQDIMGVLTTNH